ncbi:unnamed protein product [Albugo candida]|uniref:Uncharacterized protein n=1 Tax=Albugo candida TaxID=65357 RepID=A0A024G5N7_9STRA|nr:unnamed protein product [Albugo candida]|eukprot:CCI42071.1 unnamed protein product [Albugo candida]
MNAHNFRDSDKNQSWIFFDSRNSFYSAKCIQKVSKRVEYVDHLFVPNVGYIRKSLLRMEKNPFDAANNVFCHQKWSWLVRNPVKVRLSGNPLEASSARQGVMH